MEEILEHIEQKHYSKVKKLLSDMLTPDVAELLEKIENDADILIVFRLLPKSLCAEVFSYISPELQETLIRVLTDKEVSYIIEDMYTDDIVELVEEMPANVVEKALKNSTKETRQLINKMLRYSDNTAGSLMTTEFMDLKSEMTVAKALSRIRRKGKDVETINVLYVTTKERILTGVLSIRDLLLADEEDIIEDLMEKNIISVDTSTDQEQMALTFQKYDFLSLPVVDKENRLVGIVTIDDVVDIINEEATEDISIMNAVAPSDKPYLKMNIFQIWLNRVPWLMLLMISATFTGLIITNNEAILSKSAFGIVLTSCIPMLMGTGGNAGGQSSATIIRGIALNEISIKDYFVVVWKEIRVAVLLGLSLAIACFLKLLFIDGLYTMTNGYLVSAVVCLAMFVTVLVAKFVGCTLPLIAKQCKCDPAVMASPFITTILDTLSLLILCGLTTAILPI